MPRYLSYYLLLLISAVIWGVVGPVIKNTLFFVEPITLLFWRFVFTVAFVLPFFLWYLTKNPIKIAWIPKLVILGILGSVLPLVLVFYGFKLTSSIEGTVIASISPLLVAVAAAIFLREKLNRNELIGILLAMVGTAFVAIEPLWQNGVHGDNRILGNILVLLYALSWAWSVILVKQWKGEHIKPFHMTASSFIVCLVVFAVIVFMQKGTFPTVDLTNFNILGGLLYMSFFSSIIAYTFYYIALDKMHAAQADIFNYLQPVFSIPLAMLWLNEKITLFIIIGMVFIVSGVVVAEYFAMQRRKQLS